MSKFLRESESGFDRIDTNAGVIYGVKVLGPKSRNGRVYEDAAIRKAVSMYEGVTVNLNHQRIDDSRVVPDRPIQDGWGVLRNARYKDGSVFADLHYLKNHPATPQLVERAQRFPDTFGLSHDAAGDEQVIEGERRVIELFEIRSVDVVADPATNSGLFESVCGVQEVRCPTGKGGGVDNSCKRKNSGGIRTIGSGVRNKSAIHSEAKANFADWMKTNYSTPKKFKTTSSEGSPELVPWLSSPEGKAASKRKAFHVDRSMKAAADHERRSEYGSAEYERAFATLIKQRPVTDFHLPPGKESLVQPYSKAALLECRCERKRSRLKLMEVKDGDGDGFINDGKPSQAPAPKKEPKAQLKNAKIDAISALRAKYNRFSKSRNTPGVDKIAIQGILDRISKQISDLEAELTLMSN